MNTDSVRSLLTEVAAGQLNVESALGQLRRLDVEDLGYARVDHHRPLRTGFPEVIYSPGKTPQQVAAIAQRLVQRGQTALATRAAPEVFAEVREALPDARYEEVPRLVIVERARPSLLTSRVLVATGGTADVPVAEEAAITAELTGSPVDRLYDVGVAGIHRLLAQRRLLDGAAVVIAVAGMEGALPSVVGGLVDKPVIAVPTSVGYGASFGGVAALLAMLNSCAPGVAVVNIDNGFGAGLMAGMINRLAATGSPSAGPETDEPANHAAHTDAAEAAAP